MFFNRKILVNEFNYQVMGLDFNNNHTYNNYVKYFDEYNSMVVFSTIFDNSILVYRLTPEQYKDFKDGKYALSHDGKGFGKTPTGYNVKNYGINKLFSGSISRKKTLKEMLDIAEEIAIGKKVELKITKA